MSTVSFQKLKPDDNALIALIAAWYGQEWNMPIETTIQMLSGFPSEGLPFQIIMTIDGVPAATGGLYNHVRLLDLYPGYKMYGPWLALVYTTNENRNKGYGTLLCERIQDMAKDMGVKEIFLYTFTAESLYKRMGWQEMERISYKEKNAVVMRKVF